MRRGVFIASAAALAVAPRAARATGGLEIDLPPSPVPLPSAAGATPVRVLISGDRGGRTPRPLDVASFEFDGKPYRGAFTLARSADGRESVVDVVPLEAYLYGVVSLEAPRSWPRAALEAQAIVARTFALGRRSAARAYDVGATERDQLYGGLQAESAEGNAAVDATAGIVVTYGNATASVAYMSCCGGHTADAADVWGRGFPYLRGVSDANCTAAPDYHWTRSVAWPAVASSLAGKLEGLGSLSAIAPAQLDSSGRARAFSFIGTARTVDLPAADVRRAFGAAMRSSLVRSISVQPGTAPEAPTLLVDGGGRGHGVGMCQWGARGLALAGKSARDIIAFYFPGTSLTKFSVSPSTTGG